MQERRVLTILLLASLTGGCLRGDPPPGGGLFCDVVPAPVRFPAAVAQVVARDARDAAVRIDAQNRYGERECGNWPR